MRSWLGRAAFLAVVAFAVPALAQSRIDQLTAGAAVSGTDSFPACQGCGAATSAVGVTAEQIRTFTSAGRTTHGDSIYTILSTDRYVVTSATLTAPRVWTLPAASALAAGTLVIVEDEAGGVSATNTLSVAPNGTDTINGANNSSSSTIAVAYGGVMLKTDGSAKWSVVANTLLQACSAPSNTYMIGITASGACLFSTAPAGVAAGGTGLATFTSNTIYKGNGTSALATSALTDDGTIVKSSENIDTVGNGLVTEVSNEGVTGTTLNKLAKLTGAPSTAIIGAITDTDGIVGIVIGGAGTTSSAQIAHGGQASCVFDGATTAGDFVTISSTTAGDCHDAGVSRPTTSQTIGRVLSTHASGGTYAVALSIGYTNSSGGGSGTVNNCTTADAVAYYSATGTAVSCLSAVGTSGQVLTSNGAGLAPTWQAAGGGGVTCESASFTAVEGHCMWVQDVSAASSVAFTSLTKDTYRIHCDHLLPASGTNNIVVQLSSDTTGVYTFKGTVAGTSSIAMQSGTTATGFFQFNGVDTTGTGYNVDAIISGVSRSVKKNAQGQFFATGSGTVFTLATSEFSSTASAATSITVKDTTAGTGLTGRCTLESMGPS